MRVLVDAVHRDARDLAAEGGDPHPSASGEDPRHHVGVRLAEVAELTVDGVRPREPVGVRDPAVRGGDVDHVERAGTPPLGPSLTSYAR